MINNFNKHGSETWDYVGIKPMSPVQPISREHMFNHCTTVFFALRAGVLATLFDIATIDNNFI